MTDRLCARQGCGHPADWHRLDDALNIAPTNPSARFRCLGYDPSVDHSGGPRRQCACRDMVREPDPRPARYFGRWPPVCAFCGHRHTPGERCADHSWADGCPYNSGTYCRRENDRAPVDPVTDGAQCSWCLDVFAVTPDGMITEHPDRIRVRLLCLGSNAGPWEGE